MTEMLYYTQKIIVNPPTAVIQVKSTKQNALVNPGPPQIDVAARTQRIVVSPSTRAVQVISTPQNIVVNPAMHSVSVILAGPVGPAGPPGVGGADPSTLGYVHTQASPVSTWTINHPLQFIPNITVVDSAGDQVEGDVVYSSASQIVVTFSSSFSGKAYLS